ncbi:MAG TPA: exosortase/archaeosortase family protein [Acidobacteriaceae bacterium]|nr:exosortase/archaeosortase family protein [Acidobacteriaceae bacterium]
MNTADTPTIAPPLEATAPPPSQVAQHPPLRAIAWGPVVLLGVLLVLLYHQIAVKLVTDWYELPDFSHGFLIPFFAAYIVWDQRYELDRTPLVPTWAGVPLVILGLFELLVGVFGADLFLQRTSFILLAAGLIWTLLGSRMLGRLKFVLFVLCLAIPLPTILFNQITFPLQLLASHFASALLPYAGVPVLQEGNVINLPAMPLEVAEACSGIRSLMSLFTVAVIYGYFLEKITWRRVVLALAAIPIAVAANVARIFGTGICVQYWDPQKALGFFHEFSGWLMFLVSLTCLYFVHTAMNFIPRKGGHSA